ncbi:MAG: glycosyltransferase family 2 protein [Dorea sp.]|nr:glycosyltransferase family 2 protein [Dorea sp.]
MKVITVVVPTYNEEINIEDIYKRVKALFEERLCNYTMQLMFIDNFSTDRTRELIEALARKDNHVSAIFNSANMGFSKSMYYGLSQAEGDCAVLMFADMQDPPEVVEKFVKAWEAGYKIVIGIKTKSRESKIKYFLRGCYYKFISKISDIDHIEQFDGFGLYDRAFIDVLNTVDDPLPYLRGMIAEFGYKRKQIEYEQETRKKGTSKFNFLRLYDLAMLGLTSSSKLLMRFATFLGGAMALISVVIAIVTMVLKITHWDSYHVGTAAILVGIFLIGAVQLIFLGILGEYLVNVNIRVMRHPLVVEEKRINMKEKAGNINS